MDRDTRDQPRENEAPRQTSKERPADTIRDGSLKATLWRNEGDKGPYYATEFARTYTDADGKPRDSRSFIGGDLLKLSELARKAYERTTELRREDREQDRADFREMRRSGQARAPRRGR